MRNLCLHDVSYMNHHHKILWNSLGWGLLLLQLQHQYIATLRTNRVFWRPRRPSAAVVSTSSPCYCFLSVKQPFFTRGSQSKTFNAYARQVYVEKLFSIWQTLVGTWKLSKYVIWGRKVLIFFPEYRENIRNYISISQQLQYLYSYLLYTFTLNSAVPFRTLYLVSPTQS